MKIGDEVYVHGFVDEIRKDTIIIRNDGGYFGTATNEVLEKQMQESSENCISRQAAIEAIEEYADRLQMVDWKENPGVPYKAYALNWCINTIRDLPPAQPEPIKINIEDFNKEDWERLKKEWGNTPITVLPSAQETREERTDCSK